MTPMAKRSPKPRDMNQRAAAVVAQATDPDDQGDGKDPVAVEHGREGGHTRASRLTPKQRSEAASKAARARWASEAAG